MSRADSVLPTHEEELLVDGKVYARVKDAKTGSGLAIRNPVGAILGLPRDSASVIDTISIIKRDGKAVVHSKQHKNKKVTLTINDSLEKGGNEMSRARQLLEAKQGSLKLNNPNFPNGKKQYKNRINALKAAADMIDTVTKTTGDPPAFHRGHSAIGWDKITKKYFVIWIHNNKEKSPALTAFKKAGHSTMWMSDVGSGETAAYKLTAS